MKGVILCEFLDFVERTEGQAVLAQVIADAAPASGGQYVHVKRYDFAELALLIGALAQILDRSAAHIVQSFGRKLFDRLAATHPHLMEGADDPLDFLGSVQDRLHLDVKLFYPDAEIPIISARRLTGPALELRYASNRPLDELCIGMIEGCADYFGAALDITYGRKSDHLLIIVTKRDARACAAGERGRE